MLTKELEPIDYSLRRKQFMKMIPKSVAVIFSNPKRPRNGDQCYKYRQDSHFYYLTGFDEPDSILLLAPQNKAPFQIFVPPRDKVKELWEGKISGPEKAKSQVKADVASPSSPNIFFDDAFIEAMMEAETLYYRVGFQPEVDQRIFGLLALASRKLGRTGRPNWPIFDPMEPLSEMRIIKSRAEIQRTEVAADITAEAHVSAMRLAKPGMFEYEIEAVVEHVYRQNGAGRIAFESIVASGANACVLHYSSNNRRMKDKDLLLVDAGAEYDYYSGDITRTFPVGGTFTEPQKEIYTAVLKAQKACLAACRPGKTLASIHEIAVEILTEEMRRLKILKGSKSSLIKNKDYQAYYPHNTGHWLGMDVHDAGKYYSGNDYKNYRKLEPGMVFTVEPGLYFGNQAPSPARYKGIGVRIEDNVVVINGGCKVLTSGVPKEVEEVESLCHQA